MCTRTKVAVDDSSIKVNIAAMSQEYDPNLALFLPLEKEQLIQAITDMKRQLQNINSNYSRLLEEKELLDNKMVKNQRRIDKMIDPFISRNDPMILELKKDVEKSSLIRQLKSQLKGIKDAVKEREKDISLIKKGQRASKLLELTIEKEENLREIRRLSNILSDKKEDLSRIKAQHEMELNLSRDQEGTMTRELERLKASYKKINDRIDKDIKNIPQTPDKSSNIQDIQTGDLSPVLVIESMSPATSSTNFCFPDQTDLFRKIRQFKGGLSEEVIRDDSYRDSSPENKRFTGGAEHVSVASASLRIGTLVEVAFEDSTNGRNSKFQYFPGKIVNAFADGTFGVEFDKNIGVVEIVHLKRIRKRNSTAAAATIQNLSNNEDKFSGEIDIVDNFQSSRVVDKQRNSLLRASINSTILNGATDDSMFSQENKHDINRNTSDMITFIGSQIYQASQLGDSDLLKELCQQWSDYNSHIINYRKVDSNGESDSSIEVAAAAGHIDCVKILLQQHLYENTDNGGILTNAAMKALSNDNFDIFELFLLIEEKSNTCINIDIISLIFFTIQNGLIKALDRLIQTGRIPLSGVDLETGETFILKAIRNDQLDCLCTLISAGFDLYSPDKKGFTPLMEALFPLLSSTSNSLITTIGPNKKDMIDLLTSAMNESSSELYLPSDSEAYLQYGAALVAAAKDRSNSFDSDSDVLARFCTNFQDTDFMKVFGSKAIYEVALDKNLGPYRTEVIHQLIAAGAEVKARIGPQGESVLFAVLGNFTNELDNDHMIVKSLLDIGADINLANFTGETPLFQATSRGDIGTVKFLIDKGADINLGNIETQTSPLTQALHGSTTNIKESVYNARQEIAKILLENGAVEDAE